MVEPAEALAAAPAATSAAPAATSRRGGAGGNIVPPVATSATSAAQGSGDIGDARGDTRVGTPSAGGAAYGGDARGGEARGEPVQEKLGPAADSDGRSLLTTVPRHPAGPCHSPVPTRTRSQWLGI